MGIKEKQPGHDDDDAANDKETYPSIPSVAGSASRNVGPIINALGSRIDRSRRDAAKRPTGRTRARILEVASGTGEHLIAFANRWNDVDWVGSERSPSSLFEADDPNPDYRTKVLPPNILSVKLDVLDPAQWVELNTRFNDKHEREEDRVFDGIVINNLFHCAPFPETPTAIFKQADDLIGRTGWISVYGAFKRDQGGFHSQGDEKFHQRFTGLHPRFGLRTIDSIRIIAEESGWQIAERIEMESGNWLVIFKTKSRSD